MFPLDRGGRSTCKGLVVESHTLKIEMAKNGYVHALFISYLQL